jgi:hypothetical protein
MFTGSWTSVDWYDGSSQIVTFSGTGLTLNVRFLDRYASGCETDHVPGTGGPALGVGTAYVVGDTVSGSLDFVCIQGSVVPDWGTLPFEFTFDSAMGTLTDSPGDPTYPLTTWYRPGKG